VKVGFNLQRKVILFVAWISVPVVLFFNPSFGGLFSQSGGYSFFDRLGILWWVMGLAGLLLRTCWLCASRSVQTGLVWFAKILTDPFHDVKIYHMAPVWLLRGQWLDPMDAPRHWH